MSQPNKADFGLIFGIVVGCQILFLLGCLGKNDKLAEILKKEKNLALNVCSWGGVVG